MAMPASGRSYYTRVRVKPRWSRATWRVLVVHVIYVCTSIQKIRDNLDVGRNANRSRASLFNRSWTRSRRGNSCFSRWAIRFTFNSFSPAVVRKYDLLPTCTCAAHDYYGRVQFTLDGGAINVRFRRASLLVRRRRTVHGHYTSVVHARASGGGRPSAVCRSTHGPAHEPSVAIGRPI